MPKKKSVAESIEHLLKPKALAQSDSEDETTPLKVSESLANLSSKQRPSGILKRNVPELHELDKKYKGVVSSRRELEEESEEDDPEEEEASEDEDSQEDLEEDDSEDVDAEEEDDEEDDDDDEDDNDMGISDFISQFKSKVQKDVQEDSDADQVDEEAEESDEDEDDDDSADEDDDDEEDDEDDEEDEEGNDSEMETEDAQDSSMKILQPTPENPVQKGQAVRTQLDMWERILETRIKIQPILNKSNEFPSTKTFEDLQEASDEFTELAKSIQKNVATLLDNLIDLQNSMLSQFSETKAILKSGLYKRKFVDEVQREEPSHKKLCLEFHSEGKAEEVFKTYRNSVIQKWSDRTKVTSARNSKELLLNHNVISQIEGVLLGKRDLIKNSQTVKGTYELFGQKKEEQEEEQEEKSQRICEEVYDDTDFYHQMLRELIEYKSNSSTNPAEAAKNYSELQKLKTKVKKQVDQKASKGRKIRYVVHKKLVSFMAPFADSTWTEEATQELFTSLFGNYEKFLKKNDVEENEQEANEMEGNGTAMKIL